MGVLNWFTGSDSNVALTKETSDVVAKFYLKLKENNPELSDAEIYRQIIELRYEIAPLGSNEQAYEELLEDASNASNVSHLVWLILLAETPDLVLISQEDILKFYEIIEEQLGKYGLD